MAVFCASPHNAAAPASPSGSVGPSVSYSTNGSTLFNAGIGADGRQERLRVRREPCSAASRSGASSASSTTPSARTSRAQISGSGSVPGSGSSSGWRR